MSPAEQLTQRLVWASALLTLASFAPDVLAGAGAAVADAAGSAAPPWLVLLHGTFAFTTLTVVFSEDYETPAVAVHAVGASCCLALLWQAATAAQMPALPLQLSLVAAAVSAAANAQHFASRCRPQARPSVRARRLRQWLQALGCVGCGLLWQAGGGSTAGATLAALLTAAVTLAIEHRAAQNSQAAGSRQTAEKDSAVDRQQEADAAAFWATAHRLWGNWPALSATLLLMLDAALPLMDPAAVAAPAAALPTALAMAGNALLIPRALAIPNMMFLTAVSFGTAANWTALGCKAALVGNGAAAAWGATTSRLTFVAVTAALYGYMGFVERLHAQVGAARAGGAAAGSSP